MYFISRLKCWKYFFGHLKPLIFISIIIYAIALPVMFFLWTMTGGSALVVLPSMFQSCNFVIGFINKKFILPNVLKRLFDHVIVSHMTLKYNKLPKGVLHCYLPGYYGETAVGRCVRKAIQLSCPLTWLVRLVFCFLINMIPFVGPLLVILVRASRSGFSKHHRYFQLKGYTNAQVYFIWVHQKHSYFMFGFVALLLESIPGLGYFFVFANTIGAALWAVDLEDQMCRTIVSKMQEESDEDPSDLASSSSR